MSKLFKYPFTFCTEALALIELINWIFEKSLKDYSQKLNFNNKMDRIYLDFCGKDIPVPPNNVYMTMMITMILSVCTRVRWKLAHFKHPEWKNNKNNYGFKTPAAPPHDNDLNVFEEMMLDIPNRIKFKNPYNAYQKKLKSDITNIKKQDKVIVSADKTRNSYLFKPEDHSRLMSNSITKDYKKDNTNIVNLINKEAASITKKLEISDRVDKFRLQEPFVTVKDHKPDFPARIDVRLINPAKSNIGHISKQLLDKINNAIREKLNVKQWKSTDDVIKWFDSIPNKSRKRFFQFDIVNFYPSISEKLFTELLVFARKYIDISKDEEDILRNARKQILYWNGQTWTKSNGSDFDVSMGSLDGAEFCELAGLFALFQLSSKLPDEDAGLYRDDGLGVTSKYGPGIAKIEKILHSIFKSMGLKITTNVNIKQVEFLDVIMDLSTGKRIPYRKPLDTPTYVNANSCHPPSVIKQIPKAVQSRLSKLASSKDEFDLAVPPYQDALRKAGYFEELKFEKPSTEPKQKRNRARHSIYFNPPFSLAVSTNLTKMYAEIISKSFPKNHPYLNKLFNKNNMKLSYSCAPNMDRIVSTHNMKLLNSISDADQLQAKKCSCSAADKINCPLDNQCLTTELVYQADVSSSDGATKMYIGLTEPTFKQRLYNHRKSFKNREYEHETTLSTYIWQLKDQNIGYSIKWKMLKKSRAYSPTSQKCHLCLDEKLLILKNSKNPALLNKTSELFGKCRHRRKHLLMKA